MLMALVVVGFWQFARPRDCRLEVRVNANAPGRVARVIDVIRADGLTRSQVLTPSGAAELALPRMAAREHWQFSVRFDDSASPPVHLTGCPRAQGDYELEDAHVVLAPN
jgi:hypothetical protein